MGTRVCPNCSTDLDPEYAFCPECGARLEQQSQPDTDATDSDIEADLVAGLQEELEATKGEEVKAESPPEPEPDDEEFTLEPDQAVVPESEPEARVAHEDAVEKQPVQPEVEVVKTPTPARQGPRFRIVRLARGGGQRAEYDIPSRGLVIGRVNVDVSFPEDETVSPRHATMRPTGSGVEIEDTGSLNGIYPRLKGDHDLTEGDTFMCGDQLFRFSVRTSRFHAGDYKLYAAPHEKMVLATLTHILKDGVEGEVFPIRASSFRIGRDEGDVKFQADRFMSRKHAVLKKADKGFVLSDAGSRNGTYLCKRGNLALVDGDIFMIGRQMLRLEVVSK